MIMNTLLDSTAIANAIASAMHGALSKHSMELDDIKAEADAVQAKRDDEMVTREGTLRTLAEMSATNAWTAKQVDAGAAIVSTMSNGKLPASVKTFANELRVVMQPVTREAFPSIMAAAMQVWADEELSKQIDGKEADMPARKAWKRRYHTIMQSVQALPTHNRKLDTPELIVTYARECDPDINAKKAFKRIEALRDELSTIALNFPEQDIRAAYDVLADVTIKTMEAARAASLAHLVPTTTVIETAPTAETMKQVAAAAPEPAPKTETASDILDAPKPAVPAEGVFDTFAGFNGKVFQSAGTAMGDALATALAA